MTMSVTIPEPIARKIKERKPFKDEHDTQGYLTRGGTYVIATQGRTSDDNKPRDLLAIVPDATFTARVIPLWPAVRHELLIEVERIIG